MLSVLVVILFLSSTSAFAGGIGQIPSAAVSHQIQAIIDSISANNVRSYLDTLVSFTFRHTVDDTTSLTTGIGAARRWVYRKFQEFSTASGGRLQPQYFDFTATICGVTRLHRNVMAVLPGTVTPNRYFVVSGHLDTRGDPNNSCAFGIFSPGANDDGSGTAASIEMARVLSRYQFDASLIFMAVVGEDEGLFGSEAYAAYAQANSIRIDGMITNDVIGNITGSNGITDSLSVRHFSSVNDATSHRQMARAIKLKVQTYYPIFTVNLIPDVDRPGRGGDHQSFQAHGYTAVRFTEPNENLAYQHTPNDIVANLSPAYVARVTRVNALGLASLAWAPEKPSAPTLADPGNGTTLQVQWSAVPPVSDLAGYRVAVRDSGGLFYTQVYTAGNVTQYTINNLTPSVAVYVSVSAYDTAGNESMFSNETLGRPAVVPAAPTSLSSTSSQTNARLTWTQSPQLDVVRYRIYRSAFRTAGFARYDSVAAPTVTYADNGLLPHELRYYHVRAVDADGNESSPSSTVSGQRATHDLGVLVVDATKDGPGGAIAPTDSAVDAYYAAILAGFSASREWDVADSTLVNIGISDADMAPYSSVVWHSDVRASSPIYQDSSAMRKYLQQGGRVVISGWRLSTSLKATAAGGLNSYPIGTFVPAMLKIDSTSTNSPIGQDFYTAIAAASGFGNVQVDSVKIPAYNGTLVNTDVALPPFNHPAAQTIFTHHGKTPGSVLEGKPVAWRYIGSDFKVTVFDFPLYYMQQDAARAALRKALLDMGEVTGVEETGSGVPTSYSLYQNYPNPFNPSTVIRYALPTDARVTMEVFDVLGRRVAELVNGQVVAGFHNVEFNASHLASGLYFYRMQSEGRKDGATFTQTRKLMLLK
jgi:hypothetical protein